MWKQRGDQVGLAARPAATQPDPPSLPSQPPHQPTTLPPRLRPNCNFQFAIFNFQFLNPSPLTPHAPLCAFASLRALLLITHHSSLFVTTPSSPSSPSSPPPRSPPHPPNHHAPQTETTSSHQTIPAAPHEPSFPHTTHHSLLTTHHLHLVLCLHHRLDLRPPRSPLRKQGTYPRKRRIRFEQNHLRLPPPIRIVDERHQLRAPSPVVPPPPNSESHYSPPAPASPTPSDPPYSPLKPPDQPPTQPSHTHPCNLQFSICNLQFLIHPEPHPLPPNRHLLLRNTHQPIRPRKRQRPNLPPPFLQSCTRPLLRPHRLCTVRQFAIFN